ncbi:MAG: hypothetical protein Q8N99_08415 [Nanoarchaeota archaeon]|nr:hypothetical protein [Nanoarchaeota archaeon]
MKSISLFIIAVLLMFNIVSADDYYCFIKLKNTESAASDIESISKSLVCRNGRCTCTLESGGGYCQVCVDEMGKYSSYVNCLNEFCKTDPNEDKSLELEVVLPFEEHYNKNKFNLEINASKNSKIAMVDNINGGKTELCNHCNHYNKLLNFNLGFNDITVIATKGLEKKERRYIFFIDKEKPRIIKILPNSRGFSNGKFSVYYSEDNIKELALNYKVDGEYKKKIIRNCENGKSKNCTVEIDLSGYENQELEYYFNLIDIGANSVSSRVNNFFIDTTSPVLKDVITDIDENNIEMTLYIEEMNLDKVYFSIDEKNKRVFCYNLKNNLCSKRLTLSYGEHKISFNIIDNARNEINKDITISV